MSNHAMPTPSPADGPGARPDAGTRREFLLAGAAMAGTAAAATGVAAAEGQKPSAKDASNPGPENSGLRP